jgi:tetratricopeptide (TPR) repeat protein
MKASVLAIAALLSIVIALLAAAPQNSSKPGDAASEAARLNNLGNAYMNQQLFEKALKAFHEAAALDPKMNIAKMNEGIALLNLQKVDQAKPILSEAAKADPNEPFAWYNLGLLEKNSGNPEAAAAAFKRVTEIDANDPDAWYLLGTVYVQQKQYQPAVEAFQRALKLNPLDASAEFGLARAYQQSGDAAQGREHLKRFQYITQNKLGATMSLAYGEQGKYSRTKESPALVQQVPPATKVRFVDVTASSGLKFTSHAGSNQDLASYFGSGACFLDYDGDGKMDIFLADNGPQGGMALFRNAGAGKFEDVTKKAGLDGGLHGIGCTAGDYDNDGSTDIAVSSHTGVLLLHNEKNGTFKDVTEAAGIKNPDPVGVTFIDYDHDGDLDLYVTGAYKAPAPQPGQVLTFPSGGGFAGNFMWRNNGNATFTNVTEDVGLHADPGLSAVGTDYNNDRAVDLLITDVKGPSIYENPREGKFPNRTPWVGKFTSFAAGIAVFDFNHDGWMDVAFTHAAAPGLTLWRNNNGKSFEAASLPAFNWARAFGVAAFDYDNDGWIDLAAVGETKDGKGEIRLFRNMGSDGFKDVTAEVGLDKITLKDPRALLTADFDGDGATDLLITQNHGPAVLLRNQGGNQNHWLRLAFKGLNDNKSAIGTKIEVFAGGNRQKWEIAGSSGYLGQNSTEIIAGLGPAKQADVVRMLWPTGVLQDEIEIAANKQQEFMEIDRRGSSCPTLFVWNGRHYELVADVIGAGVIGHWVAPGERNIPRPIEYVKLERNAIQLKNGKLSFRIMEPMEEVVYLDKLGLLAVDHPSGIDVFPNEYFAANPPYPEFKVIESRDAKPPAGAWDDHGHNVLPDILAHRYFGDFDLLPFKGFTKPHSLELDLGEAYRGGPLRLLMHGEIEYFTATGMYAASQAGLEATSPYVEAQDSAGKWHKVIDDMGFPAGLPRTITADLTRKLPVGTRRIRIWTNLQIYWDNILIDRTPQANHVQLTAVPLDRADLRFHGYPKQIEDQPPGNVRYVYEQVSRTGPYARQAGTYTRYGDVRPLLSEVDDRFVVFGSGEEIALEFDPAKLPALPKGWTRDYFFVTNGYEKDMDFYAAHGDTVEPLPFAQMKSYPYPDKAYPLDDAHFNYLLEYNTRHVSGDEPTGYSYEFRR